MRLPCSFIAFIISTSSNKDGYQIKITMRREDSDDTCLGMSARVVQYEGAIAATFVCPLDVIKARLQVHGLPEAHHSGPKGSIIITSLKNLIRTEGLNGLNCGLSPTLVAQLPNWAVYFTVYGYLKDLLHTHVNNSGQLTFGANMIAASGAGAVTAIAANPLWVVKTRLQVGWILLSAVSFKLVEVD